MGDNFKFILFYKFAFFLLLLTVYLLHTTEFFLRN